MDAKRDKIVNSVTGINEEAQKVIEKSIQKEKKCKAKTVSELMTSINRICDESGIQYFAMGKLLTWCMYGEDSYPETNQYFIGMLRKDYDIFLKKLEESAAREKIKISLMYDPKGVVRSLNTYVTKKKVFKDKLGKLQVEISLRVEPYDYLPSDAEAAQKYMKEAAEETRYYRSRSRAYYDRRQKDGQSKSAKMRTLPFLLKMYSFFKKEKKKYDQLIRRYSDGGENVCAGRIELLNYPAHDLDELRPVERRPFLDTDLMIPAKPEEFMLLPMEEEDKKAARGRIETVQTFDRICREHGLTYVAMRDLAIACAHRRDDWPNLQLRQWYVGMLRKDYDKVMELLSHEDTAGGLIMKDRVNEYPFIKDMLVGVLKKEYAKRFPGENDYLLYIIPLDHVPADYETSRHFLKSVSDAARSFDERIQYEKGLVWDKPAGEDTFAQYKKFTDLMRSHQAEEEVPDQVFAYYNDRVYVYPYMELFPVKDSRFHGFELACPNNPFYWHELEDKEYTEYMAGERTKLLGELDSFCAKYDVPYFAIASLLIGAMIYHDVIPESGNRMWDIGFLRDDYERLVRLLDEKGQKAGLELHQYLDREKKYYMGTDYVTFPGRKYSNVRIRILPFDKVPEDFYLMQGFFQEMDEKNEAYEELINRYKAGFEFLYADAEVDKEREEYLKKAVPLEEANSIKKLAVMFNDDDRTHSYRRIAFAKSKMVTEKELFPLQRVDFRGIKISCPKDTSVWQPVLDSELARQVEKIQKADLLLIQEFDRVCEQLGLGYFICGGTMLGYMRHQGFIPWDDDVDCAMLRADYDRFIKEAGPLLKEGFFLQTRDSDPNIPYLFTKIRLDNTEYITKYNENRDFHKGICLDIFPFDYLPNDLEEREAFVEEVQNAARAHHKAADQQYPVPKEEIKPRNEKEAQYIREQKERLARYWKKDLKVTHKAYLDVATRYNDQAKELGLLTVGSFVPTYTFIDLKDLLPYQRGTFEGISVSVPKRPDLFLTMQYGDYMKLPPRHDQVAHRLERWATWEDSGSRYPEKENKE